MHDAALVRIREGHRDITQDVRAIGDGYLRAGLQQFAQRATFDERHGEERHAVRLAGGDDRDDVRVLQSGDELDLAMEAVEAHAAADVGRQQLDDDLSIEPALGREKDVTHPAATELALDGVGVTERESEPVDELRHWWDESSGISMNDRRMTTVGLATP